MEARKQSHYPWVGRNRAQKPKRVDTRSPNRWLLCKVLNGVQLVSNKLKIPGKNKGQKNNKLNCNNALDKRIIAPPQTDGRCCFLLSLKRKSWEKLTPLGPSFFFLTWYHLRLGFSSTSVKRKGPPVFPPQSTEVAEAWYWCQIAIPRCQKNRETERRKFIKQTAI